MNKFSFIYYLVAIVGTIFLANTFDLAMWQVLLIIFVCLIIETFITTYKKFKSQQGQQRK